MCGVAIEEPSMVLYCPPGTHDKTVTPGATRLGASGFSGRSNCWLPEKTGNLIVGVDRTN